ncbi:hypothetical protein ACH41H_48735 [Streptomyces sp. NPDC020800]|uniref:hypothetical protein n=1 Tax=Streptomyces sp. NPDC020800 TaxID=3365092 RepID=UPI0037B8F79C
MHEGAQACTSHSRFGNRAAKPPLVGTHTALQTRPEPLLKIGSAVGIDMGIAHFLADSNGAFVLNPQHGAKPAAKLEVPAVSCATARLPRRG